MCELAKVLRLVECRTTSRTAMPYTKAPCPLHRVSRQGIMSGNVQKGQREDAVPSATLPIYRIIVLNFKSRYFCVTAIFYSAGVESVSLASCP